jgi:hypothetical protein
MDPRICDRRRRVAWRRAMGEASPARSDGHSGMCLGKRRIMPADMGASKGERVFAGG